MFTHHPARIIAAIAVAGLAAGSLAACSTSSSGSGEGSESAPFRLATSTWVGFGPWYIAEKKGYFDDHGVDVEITNFDDYGAELAAVSSGQVDGANYATNAWLQQLSQGVELDLVMMEDRSTTADAVIGGPGIASLDDLVGKTVAYETGTTSELLYLAALDAAGIDPEEITHVELHADQAGSALIAGQVDAAVTYEPYISTALAQDGGATVIYSADEIPGIISDGLVVDPDYIEANPDTVSGMTAAWNDAVEFLADNPDEGRQIIADALGAQSDDLASAFEGVSYYTAADSAEALTSDFVSETIPLIAESMRKAGLIETVPDFESFVSTDFVE
ncbi:MAG: aliphatic sulfonate ABC transporter substrate-binding protein [Solirubrobacteraceae bacterium]|nr:aliphatic sulfonate ABC transporter substrate-binding protein [Solirubrobacteraceae bacterium]